MSLKVTINSLTRLEGSQRTLYVRWSWNEPIANTTQSFDVKWKSYTHTTSGESIYTSTIDSVNVGPGIDMSSTINVPSDINTVGVTILPRSKIKEETDSLYWTSAWCTEIKYTFGAENPSAPSVPTVSIDGTSLTASLSNINIGNADCILFDIAYNAGDGESYINYVPSGLTLPGGFLYAYDTVNSVTGNFTVEEGYNYKVRARGWRDDLDDSPELWSEWSEAVSPPPTKPIINSITVLTNTTISLSWSKTKNDSKYKIEYVAVDSTLKNQISANEYFDVKGITPHSYEIDLSTGDGGVISTAINALFGGESNIQQENTTVSNTEMSTVIANLTTGAEYYIRISTLNSLGKSSKWSNTESFILGLLPGIPTTWASDSLISTNDSLKLYWTHNSKDSSLQTKATISYSLNDGIETLIEYPLTEGMALPTIFNSIEKLNPDIVSDQTYVCDINTADSSLINGETLRWKVKTAGVYEEDRIVVFGEFSNDNVINIYKKPTVSLQVIDGEDNTNNIIESYPLNIQAICGTNINQSPIGYSISITSDSDYEISDNAGVIKSITAGTVIYSSYENSTESTYLKTISANNIYLDNNASYHINCTVAMSSGLRAEAVSYSFITAFTEEEFTPFAEIIIDKETASAKISPHTNLRSSDILLSVYRREYDGTFTEILKDASDNLNNWCVDPHPALDYARYRIIAKSITTGKINYNDIPPMEVGLTSLIIQWDEIWQDYNISNEENKRFVSNSMLKLPYNIDISKKHSPDVSLINYIGREHPVSYYGTQLGESETWKTDIPKNDVETLYAIRRLARWMGNVYVREPSGSGYWANITVNYNIEHINPIIPISFNVTRVEGGK